MRMLISALSTTANAVLDDFTYTEPVDSMELPLVEELWLYFNEKYLNPVEYYPNLDMGTGTMLSIRLIIIGLFIGLIAACFVSVFTKHVLGKAVRAILEKQAFSPDTAMTLEDIGIEKNDILCYAVSKNGNVRRVVRCVEEEEHYAALAQARAEYESKRASGDKLPAFKETSYSINPYADRFYIPEELKYSAEIKFDKKGNSWAGAAVCAVILLVVMIAALVGLPYLLSLLDNVAGMLASSTPSNVI